MTTQDPIMVGLQPLEAVNQLTYLGSIPASDRDGDYDVVCQIAKAGVVFQLLRPIWSTPKIDLATKIRLLNFTLVEADQWQRKKAASPTSVLRVVPIGEAGVDTGALRKEFLSDMISGIESRFFEGPENKGKNPKYSLTDLDNENFRTVGEIIAVSLAQGGPSPAFFKEWCYNVLCSGEVDFSCLSKEDVADVESSLLISKVEDAADIQSLMLWADEIVSCGYTNQIEMDSKESMIRAIVLHCTTRLIPMLQELKKGMELYGLVNLMAVNPEACHSLFVTGKILKWMTGQSHVPILPDEKRHFKITCKFDHECKERLGDHSICYPVVSASTVTFVL
ncbi:G2/M phase-specific E3 ubiquitin-protein ligase-like [Oreochromis aureus]|uniref:G2/M phase-specific E3 ubiquitin-protein ligase-like n=1 Tax=Oreochromis aureus TaxID=47969 RepID=UPI0019544311|nr:G2/M phase-specific E3 ubiquitin-protein ligase-like [Oreochromis aureus]